MPSPIGKRLAHLIQRKKVTAGDLAARAGLDAAALASVIDGGGDPTVDVLWKIANALDVRLGSLLSFGYESDFALTRGADTPRLRSRDGGFVARALSPFQHDRPFELYAAELAPGAQQRFEAHPPRTFQNLAVHGGSVEVIIGRDPPHMLEPGDWTQFQADVPHSYRNCGSGTASFYLVICYEPSRGRSEAPLPARRP